MGSLRCSGKPGCINPKADADLIHVRAATDGKELRSISYSLQDLVEKQL